MSFRGLTVRKGRYIDQIDQFTLKQLCNDILDVSEPRSSIRIFEVSRCEDISIQRFAD